MQLLYFHVYACIAQQKASVADTAEPTDIADTVLVLLFLSARDPLCLLASGSCATFVALGCWRIPLS